MRTFGLSHQFKGPTTVKVAETDFNCKIARFTVVDPYVITHRCACEKSYISIKMTSITWAGPRCVQDLGTIFGPQNRTQGRCVKLFLLSQSMSV